MVRLRVALYTALFLAPSALYAQQREARPEKPKQAPAAASTTTAMLDTARVCKLMQAALIAVTAAAKSDQATGGNDKPAAQRSGKAKGAEVAAPIKC